MTDASVAAEFDVLTGRLGIDVPADLKGGVLRGYRGLREMTRLLRDVPTRHPGRTHDATVTSGG